MTLSKEKKERLLFFLIKLFWPNNFKKNKRTKVLSNLFKTSVKDRLNDKQNKEYIEPWAFIRVSNEIKTLETSLKSIVPTFKKGVIGYNNCTDGSEEVILSFCKNNPGFIPFKYTYNVRPPKTGKEIINFPYEESLAAYYNKVLEFIPKGEWFMKIDVDHFYFQDILKHSFSLPKSKHDIVIYSRLELVRMGNDIRVYGYIRPGDQWLIFNENVHFENKIDIKNNIYCETIIYPKKIAKIRPECSNIHFPLEKNRRKITQEEFNSLEKLEHFIEHAPTEELSPEVLNINNIYSIFNEFDKH